MTNDTGLLNDTELSTVAGGGLSLIRTSTIVLPHIPRDKDLVTPQMIDNLLNGPFNPPPTHGRLSPPTKELNGLISPPVAQGGEFFSTPQVGAGARAFRDNRFIGSPRRPGRAALQARRSRVPWAAPGVALISPYRSPGD